MKLYVALIHVIFICSISGSTLGDCTHAQGTEPKSLHDLLLDSLDKCFLKIGAVDLEELKASGSLYIPIEEIADYCGRQDLIKNCLSTMLANSSACHNETQRQEIQFLEDILKLGLSYSCVNQGELFGQVIFGVFNEENSTPERNAVTDCINSAKSTVVEGGHTPDSTTGILRLYSEIMTFKKCLVDRFRGFNKSVLGVELILNRILRSMKCHHPEDAATVLCDTLNTAPLTDDYVCLFGDGDDDELPRFLKLVDYAGECLQINSHQLEFHALQNVTTLDEYQTFMSSYCENKPRIQNCLDDVSSNTKVCLNGTHPKALQTIVGVLEHSLESGCQADGENLATILNGIFNRKDRSVSNETLHACLHAVNEMSKSVSFTNEIIDRSVLAYRFINTFKQCILDGASEEGAFKSVFGTFMNEILSPAKCVNPEDDTVVPCSTLINN